MDDKATRIKRTAWRVARAAFEEADWCVLLNASRVPQIVDIANCVVTALADAGCLADEYGDDGSFEISLLPGYVAMQGAKRMSFGLESLNAYRLDVFDAVRKLDAAGVLTDADRKRSRTLAFDREEAERKERAAAEAERERLRKEAQERRDRAERREAAKKRLAEIERMKNGNSKREVR